MLCLVSSHWKPRRMYVSSPLQPTHHVAHYDVDKAIRPSSTGTISIAVAAASLCCLCCAVDHLPELFLCCCVKKVALDRNNALDVYHRQQIQREYRCGCTCLLATTGRPLPRPLYDGLAPSPRRRSEIHNHSPGPKKLISVVELEQFESRACHKSGRGFHITIVFDIVAL